MCLRRCYTQQPLQTDTDDAYLWKMVNNKTQCVVLHVCGLHTVCCLQDLNHILKRHIHLKVLLTKGLQAVVSEAIEVRSTEEVQRVFWWHIHICIVYVTQ